MGCPGGMSTFCLVFTSAFRGNFFFSLCNEKKDRFPSLDEIMIAFFPEKYTVKDRISNTKRVQGILIMPPGYPIILLNRINSIWPRYSVKRSIDYYGKSSISCLQVPVRFFTV